MDLTNYKQTALSHISSRFLEARRDPTMLVKAMGETIEDITNGEAVLVDATSPAVMLLEMAAILSSNCISEANVNLRKQYAVLATSEEELYMHMSDVDYLDRFASPADPVKFIMAMQVDDFVSNAVYDSTESAWKTIIPRDSTVEVDGVTFTLLYPIVIRQYSNGTIQVAYDATIVNPVYTLSSTIIDSGIRKGAELENWLFFEFEALQVKVTTEYFPIDKTYNFTQNIVSESPFYYARVFYRNDTTKNLWKEMRTTHTDQVFDASVPTAVLKVTDGNVNVKVPVVYVSTGLVSGEIRVDVYTTNGKISMNLKNFRQDAFTVTLKAIDEEQDLNDYTVAMENVSYYAYSQAMVASGKAPLPFDDLRQRVIDNATGENDVPITNVALGASVENDGFDIVRNIDTLTNRVFLATRKLPLPTQTKLITAANVGIVTYIVEHTVLKGHSQTIVNDERTTIRSKTLFINENGKIRIVTDAEIAALQSLAQTYLVDTVNARQYLYTPFYYVLDATGEEYEIRSYALDQPYAKNQNFVRQNNTLQLFVNTGSYQLAKVHDGYELRIVTSSGSYYKLLEDGQVGVQLAFNPEGETAYAYINGVLETKDDNDERIYLFKIHTSHDFDSDNLFCITNSTVEGITNYQAWVSLEKPFFLIHHTTSIGQNFLADETDALLGKFMLPAGSVGNSLEKLTLHFGDALVNLWKRSRSFYDAESYQLHTVDVPLVYEEDVFDRDPLTGAAFSVVNGKLTYNYLHRKGEPVLDGQGQQVYKFKAGEPVLDIDGKPIIINHDGAGRDIDIMAVDGRYYFADDVATASYRDEIESTIVGWVVDSLEDISGRLLEQSKIYFYPKTALGSIKVRVENSGTDYLTSEQSFVVDLWVKKSIFDDESIRDVLKSSTVRLLDSYISKQTINMTEIKDELKAIYGNSVTAFNISGLGGEKNYQLVVLSSESDHLCLKKTLTIQADRSLIVSDSVSVNFNKTP